jgi:hypothetical protein
VDGTAPCVNCCLKAIIDHAVHHFSGLATPDWCDRLFQLESVGGRAHEAQRIRFVWNGGGAAYRNGGADAFPRYAFRERDWHLKVLRYQRRNRKTVRSTSTHRTNDRAPCATKLENTTTTVAASQNKMRERSRLRRGASRAGQRHATNNSSDVPLRFSHSSCALATSDGHVRYHA